MKQAISEKYLVAKNKYDELYQQFEMYLPAIFFIAGFGYDIITTDRIDHLFTILQQATFLGLAFVILFYELRFDSENISINENSSKLVNKFWDYHTPALHFLIGGLLSAYTIFYFKAASLSTSLVFMFLLSSLLIANELPRFQSLGARFRMALLGLCTISFVIYLVPIILGQIGPFTFFLSILVSLGIFAGFWYLLDKKSVSRDFLKKEIIYPIALIHGIFVGLYFFKAIPPVPLTMTHVGIYHKVEKFKGNYQLLFDKPWWKFWTEGSQDFAAQDGDKIFIFTKIFSPADFSEKIYAHWQYYSEKLGWETSDKVPISIRGGREDGFRGFSYKSNYHPGEWRVLIETSDGREIGRINFDVFKGESEKIRKFQSEWH